MDAPYLIRTGSFAICSMPGWAQTPENWPIRSDFENQTDVIDAPDLIPAGGIRAVETSRRSRWQTQAASRF